MSNPLVLGLHYQLLQRAGSLINSLDGLRKELSGVAELSFPQLVVLGEESVGKSSVLERIAMLQFFPRHDAMCTRMPIKLQLKHTSAEEMQAFCASIGERYFDSVAFVRARVEEKGGASQPWSPFLPVDKVSSLLENAMNDALTKRYGQPKGVVEDVLIVEVKSTLVPNLTLIDLPGTCVNPRREEPEDIMERTQALAESYLRQEHTLVLLVMPALVRMHNYLPFRLIKKHNREAFTIGVLTRSDLARSERFADKYHEFKQQLDGKSHDYVELPHGYVAVRNRDTVSNESLEDAALGEEKWFQMNLPGYIEKKKASSPVLVEKLVEMMCTYVENTWVPSAKTKINERLSRIKCELDQLGPQRRPEDLPRIFGDIVTGITSSSGTLDGVLQEAAQQAPRSPTSAESKPYPHGARAIKQALQEESETILREAAFVRKAVDQLITTVAQMATMKLSRFEFLLTTLKAVLSERFAERSADSVVRFKAQVAIVFAHFDSDPALQRGYSSWRAIMHDRVTALLRTILWEEVLFPLEDLLKRQLRDNPGEWVNALVRHALRTVGSSGSDPKAKLVEESAAIMNKRQELIREESKLKDALVSISHLRTA